jgi:hypothetical protein
MIFGRRTVMVNGKLLEGGLGRKWKWRVSGFFSGVFWQGDQGGLPLLDGGVEDVEKNESRKRKGRGGGRHEKVRSFWQIRHRSLEDSWLLDFLLLHQ